MKACQLKDICPNYHPHRHSSSQQQQLHHHHYQEGRQPQQYQQSHSRFSYHHCHHHHQQHHNYGDFHSSTPSSPQQRHLHHNHHHKHYHQALPKPLPISPMMYILPSPVSDFEKSLTLPGLRTLFRQRSSTMYSFLCSNKNDIAQQQHQKETIVPYNLFGNVTGTSALTTT